MLPPKIKDHFSYVKSNNPAYLKILSRSNVDITNFFIFCFLNISEIEKIFMPSFEFLVGDSRHCI